MDRERLRATALAIGGRRTAAAGDVAAHLAGMAGQEVAWGLAAIDRLATVGLPVRAGRLDPTEATNRLVLDELDDSLPPTVAEGRRLVAALAGTESIGSPPDMTALPVRRFAVTIERTFDPTRLRPGFRPRLPRPIEDEALDRLTVLSDCDVRPGRLEQRGARSATPVSIAARFTFDATPGRSMTPGDLDLWRTAREGAIQVTPRVRRLAEQLAAGLSDAAAIARFRDHLIDSFACGLVHDDAAGDGPVTDWVLDQGWFDCRLSAALLAALCRARGVPARLVAGYLLWGAPATHYWMEAWLPPHGWMPFDLMAWGLSAGGRDMAWRGIYAGALDYRMKTQVFPRVIEGAPPTVEPVVRLVRRIAGGTEMQVLGGAHGRPIWSETVRIVTA